MCQLKLRSWSWKRKLESFDARASRSLPCSSLSVAWSGAGTFAPGRSTQTCKCGFVSCLQGGTRAAAGFSSHCCCLKPIGHLRFGEGSWDASCTATRKRFCLSEKRHLNKRHGWLWMLETALYVFIHTQKAYWPEFPPAVHSAVFTSIIIYNRFQSRKFVFVLPPSPPRQVSKLYAKKHRWKKSQVRLLETKHKAMASKAKHPSAAQPQRSCRPVQSRCCSNSERAETCAKDHGLGELTKWYLWGKEEKKNL